MTSNQGNVPEFKTLKDVFTAEVGEEEQGFVHIDIRQEAIKWIDKPRTQRMNANDFILVFFNITEEDLK